MFNINLLSRYRACLMGASAILIILCHAPAYVDLPNCVAALLSRGGWGVDIFLFLSGLGLYHSLSSISNDVNCSLKLWYTKRFKRLLIPYTLSYVPLCVIRGIIRGDSLLNIVGDISTLSFWTRHSGAWFVALIIPLYIIAPFLYSLFKDAKSDRHKFIVMSSMVIICLIFGAYVFKGVEYRGFIYNLQFASSRVPSFIFGMYLGHYVLNQYKIKYPLLICMIVSLAACIFKYYIPSLTISCFMALPTMLIMIFVFSKDIKIINSACNFMGNISLESYLFNGLLPFFIVNRKCVLMGIDIFCGNYLPYIIVAVMGTFLSYLVHRLVYRISS